MAKLILITLLLVGLVGSAQMQGQNMPLGPQTNGLLSNMFGSRSLTDTIRQIPNDTMNLLGTAIGRVRDVISDLGRGQVPRIDLNLSRPNMPNMPNMPRMPDQLGLNMPNMPNTPNMPNMPRMPDQLGLNMPNLPSLSSMSDNLSSTLNGATGGLTNTLNRVLPRQLSDPINGATNSLTNTLNGVPRQLTNTLDGATGSLTRTLNGILPGQLSSTLNGATGSLSNTLNGMPNQLSSTLNGATGALSGLLPRL